MEQVTRGEPVRELARAGVGLAKRVIQVSGPEQTGHARGLNKGDTRKAVCSSFTHLNSPCRVPAPKMLNAVLTDEGSPIQKG